MSSKIPDYHRLCAFAKRVPALDPDAVMTVATVHAVGTSLADALDVSLSGFQLSEGRLRVLAHLMDRDRPLSHSELAEWSGVTKGTITGLIDGLERDELITRVPCTEDRRCTRVDLTAKGRQMLDRVLPVHLARISKLASSLTAREQRQLLRLLGKVHAALPALAQ